jgi:hypothetical protein
MRQALELTPTEIRKAGWEALRKRLGVAGALKFLLQYEKGEGDYTQLRKKLYKDVTVDDLIKNIKAEKLVP